MKKSKLYRFLSYSLAASFMLQPLPTLADKAEAPKQKTNTNQPAPGSLIDTLVKTYQTNPELAGQQATLRATDEGVARANAGWRPTIEGSSSFVKQEQHSALSENSIPRTGTGRRAESKSVNSSVTGSYNLYKGGTTVGGVKAAKQQVKAGRGELKEKEQTVLLSAIKAHLEYVQATRNVKLQKDNVATLAKQLRSAEARVEATVGSKLDVEQVKSDLAGAKADLRSARANVVVKSKEYERIVGVKPQNLVLETQNAKLPFASSNLKNLYDEAVEIAFHNNPTLKKAIYAEKAQRTAVRVAKGGFLPSVDLQASASRNRSFQSPNGRGVVSSVQLTAQLKVPFYSAGVTSSDVRKGYQNLTKARTDLDLVRRQVTEGVISAMEQFDAAIEILKLRVSQVNSARTSYEGTEAKYQVGAIANIDVLQQNTRYQQAKVAMLEAQKNKVLASYQVLSALGLLTAEELKLPVELYDPVEHYDEVRGQWWGY